MGMVFLAILLTVYTDPIKGASNLHNPLNLTWQLISLQGREVLAQLSKTVPLVPGSPILLQTSASCISGIQIHFGIFSCTTLLEICRPLKSTSMCDENMRLVELGKTA